MAKPVLGTDPFAKPEVIGAGVVASTEQQDKATAPSPRHRPSPKRATPPRTKKAPPAATVPLEELDSRFAALEGRLEKHIDARLDSRFSVLEAKLDDALSRLTVPGVADGEDEDWDEEPVAEQEAYAEPEAEAEHGEDEDESEEGDEKAFVGFLKDAPKAVEESSEESSSETSSDDSSSESDVGFLDDEGDGVGFLDDDGRETKPTLLGGLLDLFTPRGLGRQLGKVGMRGRSEEVDEFGLDSVSFERASQFFDWMYQKYWRVETEGLENVPDDGRGLIVGNHSGTLPFDGVMIGTAVRLHHPAQREVRALAEDMFSTLPFVAPLIARVGGVRACPENAERLLRKDELVVVFPEGVKGTGKYYRQRYQLQRFGRGGFIKLCIRTRSPLIPVAVVGSEEIYPIIAKADWVGKPLGLPYTPITPTWPWLGLLGLVPLPTKWRIRFGEPMYFEEYGPDALEDDILINHLKEDVRTRIQDMINDMLEDRNSVWFG